MSKKDKTQGGGDFYERALTEAERLRLPEAREMEGLDEEIAMLRVRLFTAAQRRDRLDLLSKGVDMLMRMVAMRYRLSPQSQDNLAESIAGVLQGIGVELGVGEFNDAAEG